MAFLTFGDRVTLEGMEESDQEDGVGFTKGCREFELISTARDYPFDNIGTEPLVIEFLHWAGSPDILRAKPHLVADIILWGFGSVGIVESGHVVGCLD